MGFDARLGAFLCGSPGVPQAITGLGFMPKLVLFWTVGLGSEYGASDRFARFNFGVSDAVDEYSISYNSGIHNETGAPLTNTLRSFQNNALTLNSGNVASATRFIDQTVLSLDADGFTVQHNGSDSGIGLRIFYAAFGGSDIVEYTIGTFDSPEGGGLQEVDVGGYRPDVLCVFGARTLPGVDDSGKVADGCVSLGWATAVNQACIGMNALRDLPLSQTRSTSREEMISVFDAGGDVLGSRALLNQFNDDGFVLDWEQSASYRFAYLAMRGVTARVGGVNSPERATRRSVVGTGFRPKFVMSMLGSVAPSTPTVHPGATYSLGAADANAQFVVQSSDPDGRVPEIAKRNQREAFVVVQEPNGADRAVGLLDEFDATGYEINWLTADPPGLRFTYVAFGDSEYPVAALLDNDTTIIATQEGQEFGMPLRIAAANWVGAGAKGHRLILGESSALGDAANIVIELTAQEEGASIPAPITPLSFRQGFRINRIDSGALVLLKQSFTMPLVVQTSAVGDTPLIAAPGAGLAIYVRSAYVAATGMTPVANLIGLREGALGTYRWRSTLLTAGGASKLDARADFAVAWKLPENTALVASQSQAGALYWTIDAIIAAV